jgi:hypothetical protein
LITFWNQNTWEQILDDAIEQWYVIGQKFRDVRILHRSNQNHFFWYIRFLSF